MKTISKIILGILLVSNVMFAKDIALKSKFCPNDSYFYMYLVNLVIPYRDNTSHIKFAYKATHSTIEDPMYLSKEGYLKKLEIYKHFEKVMLGNKLGNLIENQDFKNLSFQEQNQFLDELLESILVATCMEVIE